jgi:translation initiation factor IF-3
VACVPGRLVPIGHFSCLPRRIGSSGRAVGAHGPGRGEVSQEELRVNDRIRISPIRLIDADGEQSGIIATDEARAMAAELGLDLVEVAPNSRPPVCKIMDYGKFKYEAARKAREAKKKQHVIHVKEIKMRPKIEDHDFGFKLRHARRFLEDGDKVKFTLRFRGREMTHPELGVRVLERVKGELVELGNVESDIRREGRTMTMLIGPRDSQKG